jgi:hypothetical protein
MRNYRASRVTKMNILLMRQLDLGREIVGFRKKPLLQTCSLC